MAYVSTPAELADSAAALFAVIVSGAVKVEPPRVYALADAGAAHADLEARRTTGSLILRP